MESLSDIARAQMAEKRRAEKDEVVDDLIASARERRLREREAERISRDSGEESDGV